MVNFEKRRGDGVGASLPLCSTQRSLSRQLCLRTHNVVFRSRAHHGRCNGVFRHIGLHNRKRSSATLPVRQFTQLLTGIHFYGSYALHLELSLRDPLCHPLVHTRTVLCLVGYLLPIIDPDHVVVAGSPVLQWFHSPLYIV